MFFKGKAVRDTTETCDCCPKDSWIDIREDRARRHTTTLRWACNLACLLFWDCLATGMLSQTHHSACMSLLKSSATVRKLLENAKIGAENEWQMYNRVTGKVVKRNERPQCLYLRGGSPLIHFYLWDNGNCLWLFCGKHYRSWWGIHQPHFCIWPSLIPTSGSWPVFYVHSSNLSFVYHTQ